MGLQNWELWLWWLKLSCTFLSIWLLVQLQAGLGRRLQHWRGLCWDNWECGGVWHGNTMDGVSWVRDPKEVWEVLSQSVVWNWSSTLK